MRKLALTFAVLIAAAAAVVAAPPRVAHATSNCYYNVYGTSSKTSLGSGRYIQTALNLWEVPNDGCTQWSGHYWGDTITEAVFTNNYGGTFSNDCSHGHGVVVLGSWAATNSPLNVRVQGFCTVEPWQYHPSGAAPYNETEFAEGSLPAGSGSDMYEESPVVDMLSGSCLYGMNLSSGVVINGGGQLDTSAYIDGINYNLPIESFGNSNTGTGC
jgi:hypothetical protein